LLELVIVRHGETAWNAEDRFRGRVNIELSERGLQQVERLADYLGSKKIEAVYCSPLRRAVQTAEAIARRQKVAVQPTEKLTDLDFGEWEGVTRQEVKSRYGDLYEKWLDRPDLAQVPGGESLEDARKRSLSAVDDIMEKHKSGSVAIVTHRAVTKVLICALLGLDDSHFWNIEHDTCGVTTFVHNGRCLMLTHHNDTSFLPVKSKT
jgi:phosphoserine phosphatase